MNNEHICKSQINKIAPVLNDICMNTMKLNMHVEKYNLLNALQIKGVQMRLSIAPRK